MMSTFRQNLALGIDIGGTKVRVGVVNSKGVVLGKLIEQTDLSTPSGVIEQAARLVESLLEQNRIKAEEVLGVGIAIPAVVDRNTGRLIWTPPHLPRWSKLAFADLVQARLNKSSLPIHIEYDGHASILAEQWLGAGQKADNVVFLIIGTGVGGGVVLNGQLYRGATGIAGGIGWFTLDPKGLEDKRAQQLGSLENMVAGPAIARRAARAIEEGKQTAIRKMVQGNVERINAEIVFDAAEIGDKVASGILREVILEVGMAVTNIVSLLNPELVILGGGVGRRLKPYLPRVREIIDHYAQPVAARTVKVTTVQLQDNVGILGAARLVFIKEGRKEGR